MKLWRGAAVATAAVVVAAMGAACGNDSSSSDPNTLRVWYQEDPNGPMGQSYQAAAQAFEAAHPDVKVEFEVKSFQQMQQSGSMFLNSNAAPDVLQYNKGTSSTGQLVQQGLITNLNDAVEKYGWDELMTPSLQVTERYQPNGVMGSGDWYAITGHTEFLLAYYNTDLFEEQGIAIPETIADLEAAMDKFVAADITPLALSGAEYPTQHLWYNLALSRADRQFVTDYQTYTGDIDFNDAKFTYATQTLADWVEKGYISRDGIGMSANDMGAAFSSGRVPIMVSGTWWYGGLMENTTFNWDARLFPGSNLFIGSGGNVWVVPKSTDKKDLAYEFIDATLQPAAQLILGQQGGIPIALDDTSEISDPKSRQLIDLANQISAEDGLAFYPDWPVPTFYDLLVAELQALMSGSKSSSEVLSTLQDSYDQHVDSLNLG